MKVRELTVTNFRGFAGERRFQLSERFTVIAGINGRGKSSLLNGLALLLARLLRALSLSAGSGRTISANDVHAGQAEAALAMLVSCAGIPVRYDVAFSPNSQRVRAHGLASAVREQIRKNYGDPTREDDQAPVAVYFTTDRAGYRLPRTLPMDLPTGQRLAHHGALSNRMVDYRDFMARYRLWVRQQSAELVAFNRVLSNFLDGFADVAVEEDPLRLTVEKAGARISLQQLSDGERAFIAMLGDLVRRLALANPELANPLAGHGVVLIDELELHLHPRWQREVVEKLRANFPNIQFIATTHSPFIIQSLRPGELITLDPEEFGEYANRSVEDIAEHVMGVEVPQKSERYLEMMKAAEEYYRLLREAPDQAQETEERLAELAVRFSDDPAYQAQLKLERAARTGGDDAPG
ncbi:AAA family ATPase [Sorangium sp. So ce385]|uniref:AAA family ATPase n=1 Tax=Sorangium sp. So ce385 TaxID=3133308 RepID=UPI003F5C5994